MDSLPAALLDAAFYPHAAGSLRLIETHVSWIALAGDYAYKVKRPVRLPFLDYGTVALRRAACATEVALNRRWAPELYLGVAEIVATPSGLRLDQPGTPVEPCVRMRRFDPALELDALIASHAVAPADLAALGARVAAWQSAGPAAAADLPFGRPQDALAAADGTFEALAAAASPVAGQAVTALGAFLGRERPALARTLARRRAAGCVRECHGDLHARNIVRLGGQLTPFDGIDFDPGLRWIDVASDVAFMVMDLEQLGRADLACAFLDGWLSISGDYDAATVLRWFLVYRALVRANVDLVRLRQLPGGAPADAALAECRRYISAAETYAARGPGRLLLTFGPSGSGKSWLAGQLVAALPAVRVRADIERKRLAGLEARAGSGSPPGGGLYAPDVTARTYQRLAAAAAALVAAGIDVIVDATFLDPARRAEFAGLARAAGAPFAIIECTAPEATLRARVAGRTGDPSEATLAVLDRQLAASPSLAAAERQQSVHADTSRPVDVPALAAAVRAVAARPDDEPPGAARAS